MVNQKLFVVFVSGEKTSLKGFLCMRKCLVLALVSLVILSVLAGCGQGKSPVSPPEKGTVTISDSPGVDVTLPRELNKNCGLKHASR